MNRFALAGLLLIVATGCEVSLSPISEPPPGQVAAISNEPATLTVSKGVALGLECFDNCDAECRNVTISSADESVLFVRRAFHLAETESYDARHNPNAFVVAGSGVGTTTLTLTDDCATRVYAVTVTEAAE